MLQPDQYADLDTLHRVEFATINVLQLHQNYDYLHRQNLQVRNLFQKFELEDCVEVI
jgi:hypothetical protein